MRTLITNWVSFSLFIFSSFAVDAKKLLTTSGPEKVPLLELYSSESCSSCPPADEWIRALKDNENLWKSFVPVVFHVNYWNHLDWKDGLSSKSMTDRQYDISKQWGSGSVYTPAFVLDGKEWRDWRKSKNHTIPKSDKKQKIVLQLYEDDDASILVKVEGLTLDGPYRMRGALLGMGIKSTIAKGENAGMTLTHNFVILNWDSQNVSKANNQVRFQFKKSEMKTTKLAVAVWLEHSNDPTPLQAAGGYL